MENVKIQDLQQIVGQEIVGFYLVAEKDLREGKKDWFLRLRLQDRSGSTIGYVWKDAQKEAEGFSEGDVLKIKGSVQNYKGQIQLTIAKLRFADHSEYNLEDFLTRSKIDPDTLAERFFAIVDKVENPFLNQLLRSIFGDKDFFARYLMAPAAKSWHHNYIHGLIEHTISVASLCDFVSTMYPVNYDLLLSGALLHDVAKVMEYTGKPPIDFTDIGRLIGHLSLSDQLLCDHSKLILGFPDELLIHLRHLVLSHHGEYEKASVRLPQTLEATVLHLCDNLDAQSVGVAQLIEAAPENASWTEFDKINNRYYKLTKF
ncbi:MAG: OB-fold nucleic acid binding domain-containing protein [Candidatus Cloacimonadaceae bacterium]|nr:OB-fold nucleic acid binding domain-containing protein [Candidatus Cloacimonadaceae bacterium]MDP3114522.1 OB-fold nucleic acid binding domain-containing protein [Candidatus Cloacimonadaceae bacterium]